MVSKLRCESLRCHNHDFVKVALDIRQTGEEAAMSEIEIVYKFDSQPPLQSWSDRRWFSPNILCHMSPEILDVYVTLYMHGTHTDITQNRTLGNITAQEEAWVVKRSTATESQHLISSICRIYDHIKRSQMKSYYTGCWGCTHLTMIDVYSESEPHLSLFELDDSTYSSPESLYPRVSDRSEVTLPSGVWYGRTLVHMVVYRDELCIVTRYTPSDGQAYAPRQRRSERLYVRDYILLHLDGMARAELLNVNSMSAYQTVGRHTGLGIRAPVLRVTSVMSLLSYSQSISSDVWHSEGERCSAHKGVLPRDMLGRSYSEAGLQDRERREAFYTLTNGTLTEDYDWKSGGPLEERGSIEELDGSVSVRGHEWSGHSGATQEWAVGAVDQISGFCSSSYTQGHNGTHILSWVVVCVWYVERVPHWGSMRRLRSSHAGSGVDQLVCVHMGSMILQEESNTHNVLQRESMGTQHTEGGCDLYLWVTLRGGHLLEWYGREHDYHITRRWLREA
ncbi:hypothetical protein Tco_0265920 [Tanacetum coccineum]